MTPPVVYVDDEPALCRAFEWVLSRAGVDVVTFCDPLLAIEFVRSKAVAVIFCDYRMPKMNALQLLQEVDKAVPFYVVSGDLDVSRWTDNESRVTGVIAKPFRAERMLEIARSHLGVATEL
ncbi:MAG: response regulator [Myxococcales bacterium]|nr:response regulator [Myxococcales bacterium]